MPDGFVFDEQAMDYVPVDEEARRLRLRVKELLEEREKLRWVCTERAEALDAARAWGRLWKRAATVLWHIYRVSNEGRWKMRTQRAFMAQWIEAGWPPFPCRTLRRALGLPDATTTDSR